MAKKNEIVVKDTTVRTTQKDGVDFINITDIAKQKKFRNGVFTNTKGQVIFAMPEADKPKYVFDNIKDDSIQSIVKQAEKIDPKLRRQILRQINASSDVYIPELDSNDDFLKHLIKLVLHEKKIDIKQFKHKFPKSHGITNIKAALETKSTPDGKKGSMTIANFEKWLEILDMEIEIKIKDSDDSDLPCGKEFKFTTQDGYNVDWAEGYDYIKEEMEEEDSE